MKWLKSRNILSCSQNQSGPGLIESRELIPFSLLPQYRSFSLLDTLSLPHLYPTPSWFSTGRALDSCSSLTHFSAYTRTQRGTWVLVPVRSIRIMLPSARRSVVTVWSWNGIMGSSRQLGIIVVMLRLANQTLPNVACQAAPMLDFPITIWAMYLILLCEEQG